MQKKYHLMKAGFILSQKKQLWCHRKYNLFFLSISVPDIFANIFFLIKKIDFKLYFKSCWDFKPYDCGILQKVQHMIDNEKRPKSDTSCAKNNVLQKFYILLLKLFKLVYFNWLHVIILESDPF